MKKIDQKKQIKKKRRKILICGAGTIGIFLGAKLYSREHKIELFGRRKLRGVGIEVIIENKKFKIPKRIFKIPKNERYDFIFITTKLYDLAAMINLIKKNNIKGPIFVGIQNGLVDTSKYEKYLNEEIMPVTVFSGLNLKGNKIHLSPTKIGWRTKNSAKGKQISFLLLDAGIPCYSSKNFDSLRAEKTIVNCSLNALSGIENKPFCDLFKNKKTRERIEKIFEECYNILGKEYRLDSASKMKKRMFENWSKLNHYSSTCQDLNSGRKVEVKFFNGLIINLGKKHHLSAENNKEILKDINKMVKKNH
jgi:2-dehydropantoate 2-reductase